MEIERRIEMREREERRKNIMIKWVEVKKEKESCGKGAKGNRSEDRRLGN